MSILSTIVNAITNAIHTPSEAVQFSGSASRILFAGLAVYLVVIGILGIVKHRPYGNKYEKYTELSVNAASHVLGVSNILLGLLTVTIGVVDLDLLPHVVLYVIAGVLLAAYVAAMTVFFSKLKKKDAADTKL